MRLILPLRFPPLFRRPAGRWRGGSLGAAACLLAAACLGSRMEALGPAPSGSCRTAVSPTGVPLPGAVSWTVSAGDRRALDRWCAAVGPAVVGENPDEGPSHRRNDPAAVRRPDSIAVVTWNVHVGGGDLPGFVDSLRAGTLTGGVPVRHFVLLVQEAWRRDTALVPTPLPAGAKGAGRIHEAGPHGAPVDVVQAVRGMGLAVVYVPSMRNGGRAAEDRGNAIVSTLPLRDVRAVELPFEAQRRVAVSALVAASNDTAAGACGALRVTSAHLDNVSRPARLLASVGVGRVRQAKGLVRALNARPAAADVVGGDFNTWRGVGEEVVETMRNAFPRSPPPVPGATHAAGLHLDYLFARGAAAALTGQRKAGSRFGSDHGPIVAWVRLPHGAACPAAPST
jgi:endonuclease/exonuclease/phosphatase family metal-dependent hydrolase